ncbi:MAG: outer membrane lipoprotein chaperone LolA [Legionellales bacterium]|nr:outer membrane lipoprotein chaperone LolA [Legionellales bacterium]
MTKRYYGIILIVFLFFASRLYAAGSTEAPAHQLTDLLNQYQSMTAHFSQSVYDPKGRVVQNSNGSMALLRPQSLRWQTQKPTDQLILTDGKTLWIYDKDLQQVTISQLLKKTGTTPAMLMTTSASDIQDSYEVSAYPSPKTEQVFQLTPKNKQADFEWVRFFFENKQLIKMQIHDNIGQLTSIDFSQLKINPSLPKSLFHLTIPKDVDIVKE